MNNGLLFTIFGGTGNLTYNKLMPAFYQLFQEDKLLPQTSIIAIGRRDKTRKEYIDEIEDIIRRKSKSYRTESFKVFKEKLYYYRMDFSKIESYKGYKEYMDTLDRKKETSGNRIFYLATAPEFFSTISEHLNAYGLLDTAGFTRAVFEKPFGYDLESATEINDKISKVFGEENIYRIDHYLGKEMIQNIIMVRFTNQIFKAVWSNASIDNVQISVKETVGVEERGGYYDQSGALRDMVQNHLLQILALIAMEPPVKFDANSIRDQKVNVLKNINISSDSIIFGQYVGYKEEEKVDKQSTTETYVALKCDIDHPNWKGVPFYLRTGKYLDSKEAEVIIEFKHDTTEPNLLVIKIQPEEGIYFRINTKEPRSEKNLMTVSMDYCQSCHVAYKSPEAYERLLYDIIQGDSTLFTRWDEVENAWKIFQTLVNHKDNHLVEYPVNSMGPVEATQMIEEDGRRWWALEDLN